MRNENRNILVCPAAPKDVRPALDFAQAIFVQYVLPDFDPPTSERLGLHMDTEEQMQAYQEGRWAMSIAWDGLCIVGMACERDGSHIRKLYVDGAYHRRGIAKALMDAILAEMPAQTITINSSRHGLPFYLNYGFAPTDVEQNSNGFIYTPMALCRTFLPCSPLKGALQPDN